MKRRVGAGKSYADVLTVLLVIIIIAIIALLGYFAFKVIDKNNVETTASSTNDEFLSAAEANKKALAKAKQTEEEIDIPTEIDFEKANAIIDRDKLNQTAEGENNSTPSTSSSEGNVAIKKTYLGNYEVKGSISIPKINCNYPILEKVTVDSLKKSIAILDIVANPELNRTVKDLNVPGTNAFILGHNYRNGQFFSNNDKLSIGDTIKITDQTGTTVNYTIYHMFYTSPDDVSFMERDVDVNTREITLQTCNDDSSERLIIFAKDN